MRRRRIAVIIAIAGFAAIASGLVTTPGGVAHAAPVLIDNACSNNAQPTPPSVIPMGLEGTAPASASKGSAFSVTSLKITAQVPAAFIQTGVGLGILKDGQSVTGVITAHIHATNATPADRTITGSATGTVHAPGTPPVAQPLTLVVSAGTKSWTPTDVGPVTLAQAKTGSQSVPPATITDGSIRADANLGALTVKIVCKPGTVSGSTINPASSVTPFLTVDAGEPVATSSTTSTTPTSTSSTIPVSTSSTTTTTPSGPHSPAIALSSTLNLRAGDLLTVSGTGFSSYAPLVMMECGPKFTTAANPDHECDVDKAVTTSSDVSGGFTASMHVLQTGAAPPNDFVAADPAAKCPPPQSGAAASCFIVVRNADVETESAVKAISFNIAGATATTQQLQQAVQVPASGGGGSPTASSAPAPGGSDGGGSNAAPVTELAATGAPRHTAALAGLGLLLLDLGYLALTASRPRRARQLVPPTKGR
jgi:hypothetical protein